MEFGLQPFAAKALLLHLGGHHDHPPFHHELLELHVILAKAPEFVGALVVLDREEAPRPSRLADAVFTRRNEAAKRQHLALLLLEVVQA